MKKKGITILTVMIAVVIMIVFASTITLSVVNISNDSKKSKFASEIAFVQESVNNYFDKNNEYPIGDSVSVSLEDVSDEDKEQFALEENFASQLITLYTIDLAKLGNIEVVYGNNTSAQDIYAVSKKTGKVYYLTGVQVGDVTYFTLTEELKKIANYVDTNKETVTKDGISFIPSTIGWTNTPISTKVLVPEDYTNITIVAKVDKTNEPLEVSEGIMIESFYEYIINDTNFTPKEGNYSIVVSYKKDEISYTQTYSITNFDNDFPTIELSDKVELNSIYDAQTYKYVRIVSQQDKLSGVKYVKYEREKILSEDAVGYFKNNGVELQNDIIEFDETTEYITVYIEDNAGNYSLVHKDLVE